MRISHDRIMFHFDAWFFLLCAVAIFFLPVKWLLGFMISVTAHELAHYIALLLLKVRIFGVEIDGSGITIRTEMLSRKQEIVCAVAGPVGGFLLMLITYRIPYISVCACVHSVYNLLPLGTLDGGRVLKCILSGFKRGGSLFQFFENGTRIMICFMLCFVAIIITYKWIQLLTILVIYRLWHQKYLAKKRNQ